MICLSWHHHSCAITMQPLWKNTEEKKSFDLSQRATGIRILKRGTCDPSSLARSLLCHNHETTVEEDSGGSFQWTQRITLNKWMFGVVDEGPAWERIVHVILARYCLLFPRLVENPVTSGNGSKWRTNLRNHKHQVIKSQTEIFSIVALLWLTKIVQFSVELSLRFCLICFGEQSFNHLDAQKWQMEIH